MEEEDRRGVDPWVFLCSYRRARTPHRHRCLILGPAPRSSCSQALPLPLSSCRHHCRLEQQTRPEIPTWGRRRPSNASCATGTQAAKKTAAPVAATANGAARTDTPARLPPAADEDHKKVAPQEEVRSVRPPPAFLCWMGNMAGLSWMATR